MTLEEAIFDQATPDTAFFERIRTELFESKAELDRDQALARSQEVLELLDEKLSIVMDLKHETPLPPTPDAETEGLLRERVAFDKLLADGELERFKEQFVAIQGGRVIASHSTNLNCPN